MPSANQHPTPNLARSPLRGRKHGRKAKNSQIRHLCKSDPGEFLLVTESVKNEVEMKKIWSDPPSVSLARITMGGYGETWLIKYRVRVPHSEISIP